VIASITQLNHDLLATASGFDGRIACLYGGRLLDSSFFSSPKPSSHFQWNNLFDDKYYKLRPDHALDYARWIYNKMN
jgi:hypothetical protein